MRSNSFAESNRRRTGVHRSARNVVELRPPQKVFPPDPVLKDKPNHKPRRVVDACGRGDEPDAIEDNWGADVFDPGLGIPSLPQPEGEWQEGTDEESI